MKLIGSILFVVLMVGSVIISERKVIELETKYKEEVVWSVEDNITYRVTCIEGYKFVVTRAGHGKVLASLGGEKCAS